MNNEQLENLEFVLIICTIAICLSVVHPLLAIISAVALGLFAIFHKRLDNE